MVCEIMIRKMEKKLNRPLTKTEKDAIRKKCHPNIEVEHHHEEEAIIA